MRSRLVPLLLVSLLLLPAIVRAAEKVAGEKGEAIDRYLSRLAAFGIAGALYVEKDGEVLVEKGYGVADRATGARVAADAPFLIGSLSKQFTAAAILALEADGKLAVTDSVGRFFPEAPSPTRVLALRQILSHTSGLPYFPQRPFFETRPRDSIYAEMLALPLEFVPGSKYAYSNCGFTLLAGVVERASRMRFEDYLRTRLFAPAGLQRTRCLEPALADTSDLLAMHSYSGADDEGDMLHLRDFSKSVGAGSVVTTVGDLGRWADALFSDRVLPPRERDLLFTPAATVDANTSYGFAWNIAKTSRGTTVYFHAGDLGGWNSEMRIDRQAGLILIFLSNTRIDGNGSRSAVMNPVTLLAVGKPAPELPALSRPDPDEARALAGRYEFADGGTLEARAEGAALEVTAGNGAGLARLAGPAGAAPDSLQLDAHSLAVAGAIARRDFPALAAFLHPALPAPEARASLDTTLAAAIRRFGEFGHAETVGSVLTGPGTALSFVRLQHARGATILRIGWVGGKVIAFDTDARAVLPTKFLRADDGAWVNIDPFTARVTRLTVERDAAGRVLAVGLGAPSAETRAKRRG